MIVKARFYVHSFTKTTTEYTSVKLAPSTKGDDNKEWSKWTPSGTIEMNIHNDSSAVNFFADHLGKDLDITFAELPAETES